MFRSLTKARNRNRLVYIVLMIPPIVLGIGSRKLGHGWPSFVTADLGDILWTVEAFLVIGLLRPRWSTAVAGIAAWVVSLADEVSQLFHAPWIDAVRATTLGGLLLGHAFIARQIALYAIGAVVAAALEIMVRTDESA
jgi:hypothetical protein